MVQGSSVNESRIVAHLGHLESVIGVRDISSSRRSHLSVKVNGVLHNDDISEIQNKFGWDIVAFSGEGLVFFKPDR